MSLASRWLFGFAGLCLAAGAMVHSVAFKKAAVVIDAAQLPARYPALLKGLWLSNSIAVGGLALTLCWLAAQPKTMSKPLIMVLASTLFGLAALTYFEIGSFLPAHVLIVAGIAVVGGCVTQ